ncbi:DMT family transporter [Endozoicomonas sp. ONNA2]|uniref:DMT family transporter n=1 Tax=Endozoicomonas sp. ONNA2 TaxID=2828741 RepID=UPI00214912FE|nr:DMT family transporter [Endozoicomonas sp. ONNA2]
MKNQALGSKPFMNDQYATAKGITLALLSALAASTAGVATKVIADDVPIAIVVLFQYGICLFILSPLLLKYPVCHWYTKHLVIHTVRGVSGWLCFFTYYLAIQHIPLVDASLLRNTAPLFVPLFVWAWIKITIPRGQWLPIIIGFAGILLILRPSTEGMEFWHIAGLLSGVFLALSMVSTRVLSATEVTHVILFYYFFISFLCSIPLAILDWQPIPYWTLPFLLCIGCSISLTMWCYTRALTLASAAIVAPINYSGVVFSGIMGWLIWSHIPDGLALTGILLVIAAGLITAFRNSRSAQQT